MARFMIKASEFKNVCKAVNDRKLAELKKEIIEILKNQDEKEVKKAIDYFESQELHYTHLEKSFNGKWVEKAGYGVGTVRIWKGKKYKKIAPGKWARVFDKEGRGTNIAIGKLIAEVERKKSVEELMDFVMAHKQRFVDDNGMDLPILNKLRAAVDIKNEKLSGESSPYIYGVGEDVSREKNKIFEGKDKITKEEADLHKVSRKFEQIPTTELKQRKAKLERWIENKTRSKRDSLNNAIFRESYRKELDAINAVLDKRNGKKETSKPADYEKDNPYEMTETEKKDAMKNPKNKLLQLAEAVRNTEEGTDEYYTALSVFQNAREEFIENQGMEEYKKIMPEYPQGKKSDSKVYEDEKENILRHTNKDYDSVDAALKDMYAHKNWIDRKPSDETEHEKTVRESRLKAVDDIIEGLKNGDKKLLDKFVKEEKPAENKTDSKVYETEKEPSGIGTFEKIDTNTVEMPTDKATRVLFDNLNKSRSTDIVREFMTDCYYDGENLVATDGKRLTIIKTGDVGFEPGYVNVKTDDGKVTLERIEGKDKKYSFPNYKKVIPENNNQEVKLDNKALKDKLKQMKKKGAFNKKNPRVNLVFEDGKVMLDGTLIGTGDVKFKDGENYVSFNGDFLNDAVLSGDNMSMSFGENSEKAVVFGSDIGKTVVMPMAQTPVDYENNRAIKKQSSNEKAAKLSNNRKENERLVNDSFKDIDGQVEKVYTNLDKKINAFSDEDLKRSYDILNLNLDKIMDRSIGFITKIVDKKTNATFSTAYAYSKLLEKHPDVKDKFLAELDRRGISVKKSLFDDFIVDVFEADEDEEIEDAIKTDESLFNDYSAEQPELFNSTEMMVREAFNRCRVL